MLYAFEVFVLWFTTSNIDYRKYLGYLTHGIRERKLISKISLFLIYMPHDTYESFDEEDDNDYTFLEKSQNEHVKARLLEYEQESQQYPQFSVSCLTKETCNVSGSDALLSPNQSRLKRAATEFFNNDM